MSSLFNKTQNIFSKLGLAGSTFTLGTPGFGTTPVSGGSPVNSLSTFRDTAQGVQASTLPGKVPGGSFNPLKDSTFSRDALKNLANSVKGSKSVGGKVGTGSSQDLLRVIRRMNEVAKTPNPNPDDLKNADKVLGAGGGSALITALQAGVTPLVAFGSLLGAGAIAAGAIKLADIKTQNELDDINQGIVDGARLNLTPETLRSSSSGKEAIERINRATSEPKTSERGPIPGVNTARAGTEERQKLRDEINQELTGTKERQEQESNKLEEEKRKRVEKRLKLIDKLGGVGEKIGKATGGIALGEFGADKFIEGFNKISKQDKEIFMDMLRGIREDFNDFVERTRPRTLDESVKRVLERERTQGSPDIRDFKL